MSDEEKRLPWMKWYPSDWRGNTELRMCGLAARGLWADLISYMHEGKPYGHLRFSGVVPTTNQIAMMVGIPVDAVAEALEELQSANVFSVYSETGAIYSRRMVRDKDKDLIVKGRGGAGGNPDLLRGTVPKEQRVRPYKRTDSPEKTRRIFSDCNSKCHWCRTDLVLESDGKTPNLFHIDHLLAIRDGGNNEESNLVASCASCNHKRAREEFPTITGCSCRKHKKVMVGKLSDTNSDNKTQMPEARGQILKEDNTQPMPLPSSAQGGKGKARYSMSDEAKQVVDEFLRLRELYWPTESRMAAPTMTIGAEVQGFIEAGAPVEFLLEVLERQMREDSRSAPRSLKAYSQSIERELRSYLETFGAGATAELDRITGGRGPSVKPAVAGPKADHTDDSDPTRLWHPEDQQWLARVRGWFKYPDLWAFGPVPYLKDGSPNPSCRVPPKVIKFLEAERKVVTHDPDMPQKSILAGA